MSRSVSDPLALGAFVVSLLAIVAILVGLVNVCVVLYGWRLRTLRERATKGKMVTIQPRVGRDSDRRPPETR